MEAMVTCLYCVGARSGRHQATASADTRGHWRLYETIQTFSHSSILIQHTGTEQHSTLSDLHPTIDNFSRKYAKENNFLFGIRNINLFAFHRSL